MFVPESVPLKVPETSKHDPPVGPYPRHIWVHPKAPKDEFDVICHEIWKRSQNLPEGLKPRSGNLTAKTVETHEESNNTNVRSEHGDSMESDISRMIEQEYMNLISESLSENFSRLSTKENNSQVMDERAEALKTENFIKSVLAKGNISKNAKAKKCYIQDRSSYELRRSGSLDKEDICSIEYTKMEARIAVHRHAVAPIPGKETDGRNVKQAGPVFMPPTSKAEPPANHSYFPPMPAFCMPHAMNYGQFQQTGRPMFYLPYLPMMHYMPYMYPYNQMRGFPNRNPTTREHPSPRMAGDGRQYRLPYPYWFNPPISRETVNKQKFSSYGNC
ncbi:uncharacterized protein C1orf94 homolog [Ranitomeya variabilis]|uniref:uncharacterized protein C1orf94 homolog n=1 Tax=Ranitomeya variabilis TaxID=490064 RepID=UPI004057CBB8